ncbi:MAG: DUF4231 domain-containing protein [Myxococcota bacterium]
MGEADDRTNLRVEPFPELDWSEGGRDASLEQLCEYVVARFEDAITWYERKKRRMKLGAQVLRVLAIIFTAVAGILPSVSALADDAGGHVAPAWTTIAIAMAALLIALDRFYGFTPAWMRFITTMMALHRMLDRFRMEWEEVRLPREGKPASLEDAERHLDLAKGTLLRLAEAVERETADWAKDLLAVLRDIERRANPPAPTLRSAG